MINWKQRAWDFDSLVYDFNQTGEYWLMIWLDDSRRNFDQITYGIYTTVGDVRMGPDNNGSERAIRNIKVKQKISGQFKSPTGAFNFAVLRSITDTALKNGRIF